MRKINCNECGKFLFETDKSDGAAGAQANRLGFVFKMPVLFTGKYDALFFCNDKCGKAFYKKNIPCDHEMNKKIEELKTQIPERAKAVAGKMARLVEILNQQNNNQKPCGK